MTAATYYRTVTIDLPDAAAGVLKFVNFARFTGAGAEIIEEGRVYSVTLDANGVGSVNLPTPDNTGTTAATYTVIYPIGDTDTISLLYNASSITLAGLVA